MTDRIESRSGHRLGFMIPMILFVLFFVACCAALVGLFVRSADISNQAGRMNDAVQICRNQAERFRAGEDLPEILYFDENYRETSAESANYRLEIQFSEETTPLGRMVSAHFSACTAAGEPIYRLDTARYVPDGR